MLELPIMVNVWEKTTRELTNLGAQSLFGMFTGNTKPAVEVLDSLLGWQYSWWNSVMSDPVWHASWTADIAKKWLKLARTIAVSGEDPRTV
jgi:hypothetical protein